MKKTIVLVEDDQNLNNIVRIRLETSGYDVSSCYSGESALLKLGEAKPDLLILDIDLPDINGLDLIAKIRNIEGLEDLKILVLTALTEFNPDKRNQDDMWRDKLGVDGYFSKPFVANDLVFQVKALIPSI